MDPAAAFDAARGPFHSQEPPVSAASVPSGNVVRARAHILPLVPVGGRSASVPLTEASLPLG